MSQRISLLWPEDCGNDYFILDDQTIVDLDLKSTINQLSEKRSIRETLYEELKKVPTSVKTIVYRQNVMEDLIMHPGLESTLRELQPFLENLVRYNKQNKSKDHPVQAMLSKISELDSYIECVNSLDNALSPVLSFKSDAFNFLKKIIAEAAKSPTFKELREELPILKSKIRGVRSMSIGVNLNHQLKPVGATLLSIDTKPYEGTRILRSLFNKEEDFTGISKLHTPESEGADPLKPVDPSMIPIFNDLFDILKKSSLEVIKGLKRYESINTGILSSLQKEVNLYLGGIKLCNDYKERGLSLIRPEVKEMEHKVCVIGNYFNINLAAKTDIVPTDVDFRSNERVAILTGPNGGGKTVFIQGLSIAQILFQHGLYVPGTSGVMSPVDGIFTHYQIEERPDENKGRFGEEAYRLNNIFKKATSNSLIIMNESFSSTNAGESLYIAEDVLKVVQKMGGWVIFATHMHELAENVENYNSDSSNKIISLVCQVDENRESGSVTRKYKIIKGAPKGQSYARELASKYGISFQQLNDQLIERGIMV